MAIPPFNLALHHGLMAVGRDFLRIPWFCIATACPPTPRNAHHNLCHIYPRGATGTEMSDQCEGVSGLDPPRVNHSLVVPMQQKSMAHLCVCPRLERKRMGPLAERARWEGLLLKLNLKPRLCMPLRPSMRVFSSGVDNARTTVDDSDGDRETGTRDSGDPSKGDVSGVTLTDARMHPGDEFIFVEGQAMEGRPETESDVDILEEQENPEILQHFAEMPLLPESYSLASYVDRSETLQKLVEMGVDLSKLQCRRGVASMLLRMDFDKDIKGRLAFLHHAGVPGEKLGAFITRNPFILGEEMQNLEARVHYLHEKGFSDAAVAQIVNRAPYFLSFSVERIDSKLGFYQELFRFNDSQIREMITRCPKLVTMKVSRPKENLFVLEFQCGISKSALYPMVLREPSILLRGKFQLIMVFDYLHNTMKIPHSLLIKVPQVFLGRIDRVKDRHKYLCSLRRDQYHPKEPGYVPLMDLFKLPDDAFCQKIAKTSMDEYDTFLKTCRV